MRHNLTTMFCLAAVALFLAGCASTGAMAPAPQHNGYFDPHNHLSGVLPWPAYADLPAYLQQLEGHGNGVSRTDKLAFYTWLADSWYPQHLADAGTRPFSSTMRFGLGARATLAVFPPDPDMPAWMLNGALQRLYTATPFTVFDSAYAFHRPAYRWLSQTYYDGNEQATAQALCTAQMLQLAHTGITRSEQSISFIGGWRFNDQRHSPKLATIMCAATQPGQLQAILAAEDLPAPRVRIILMTHTKQLGVGPQGEDYRTFEYSGACHWEQLNPALKLGPQQMYLALLGRNKSGADIVPDDADRAFFNTLVGIDTAAPETTCFTDAGMAYYRRLVDAVYRAAKKRRADGWDGKLLVHTHVGEGFSVYYGKQQPQKPWTFDKVFAQVPELDGNIVTNPQAARNNITQLLNAVAKIRASHPDLDRYVVIRFGHVTHATLAQARRMAQLHVEADINLDSNIATGAWGFAQMPAHKRLAARATAAAAQPQTNFELNNLPDFLIPDPHNEQQTAAVLGTHPLKYMLMAGVRVMLGTDGAGVEHSSMPREYALAASLIDYWQAHDPAFLNAAGDISTAVFFANANWHLANMASDKVLAY